MLQLSVASRIHYLSMAGCEPLKRFSEQLSRVLGLDSVSQTGLRTLRSWSYILEIIHKYLHGQAMLCTGSLFEGSEIKGSDVDHMRIMHGITAVKGIKELDVHSGYVFLLETFDVRPGYTKLVLMKKDQVSDVPEEMKETIRKSVEESLSQAENNESYLSSEKYRCFYLSLMKDTDKYSSLGTTHPDIYGHGPCATTLYNNDIESDIAFAIKCVNWPLDAEEWIERKREKSWPSEEMVEAIRTMPCFILPVGDPESTTKHLEWRFAFVPAERELIWSFNDSQIQCYILLKCLKKKYLNHIVRDELSTFCLKTIVFWISEEEGLSTFTPPKLVDCIRRCLIRLQESISSRFLPHYFLRKRNLLFAKFEDEERKKITMCKISEIIESLIPFIMECNVEGLSSVEKYFRLWPLSGKDLLSFMDTNQKLVPDNPSFFSEIVTVQKLFCSRDTKMPIVHLPTSLQALLDTIKALDELPTDIDRYLIESTKSFLGVRAGMTILADICASTNESMKAVLISYANMFFKDGVITDELCGHLYIATFLFISGHIEEANTSLSETFSRKRVVFYAANTGKSSCISTMTGNEMESIEHYFKITKSSFSSDMIFTSTDVSCVPPGLQYECALLGNNMNWNFCLIHPVVYAQYLHFEITHALKNSTELEEALTHLSNAVMNVKGYFEEHRALNLLGVCYSKSGRLRNAIECFVRSLEKTPTTGNAASYHLCVIIYSLLANN
ncbi:hypothetical protein ACJMK2_022721 [Sinanodonta woodiana]|uniref:Mab-21-like HhH/H2TH-like domain-containing protein n=1 Tax=Sinanodonta woodiana TaxID=1069815 RepID=A0ABD3TKQ9_SINWO